MASTPADYSPLYHASAVLPDGRVIIEGGEYNHLQAVWTNQGAIYDPLADTWTEVNPPDGWKTIGDATGVVLFDGTFMLGNCCTVQAALLDPVTMTWKPTGSGKFDTNN
ncbi:MAG TPA: kelch repeat-containing protein, partial [Steroidobacteraceae bacterium]